MHPATAFLRLLHMVVGTAIFALFVRTWVVMGLVEPVTVTGCSMAPNLVGPHVQAECDRCLQSVRIGDDQIPQGGILSCPYCDGGRIALVGKSLHRGSALWIDRATYGWRNPRRWEVIVFHAPAQDGQLCVKRVVGLPGERVHLAGGDVWIDGQRQIKTLQEQRRMRQLVRMGEDYIGAADETVCLTPCFTGERSFDDDMIYNAKLSLPLNGLSDFFFSARLTCVGAGRFLLRVEDGPVLYDLTLLPRMRLMRLHRQGEMVFERRLRTDIPRRLATGLAQLEVSTFDRQLLVAFEGDVWLRYPLGDIQMPDPFTCPFAVRSEELEVLMTEVTLWRDIYYQPLPSGMPNATSGRLAGSVGDWQLASDELFLLGDNTPVSADSRIWANPGVPRKFVVGRPMTFW